MGLLDLPALAVFVCTGLILRCDTAREVQFGCASRPKNFSLICTMTGNSVSRIKVDEDDRESTRYLQLECVDKSRKAAMGDNVDEDEDGDGDGEFGVANYNNKWVNLQHVGIRGCPLQARGTKDGKQFEDWKRDDVFLDFINPVLGDEIVLARLTSLEIVSSGLSRPLSAKSRTFCQLAENLLRLNVSSNQFDALADLVGASVAKCPLDKLTSLTMSHNKLQSVNATDFTFAKNLQDVDLSFNLISRVESGVFKDLVSLKTINLADNHISFVPPSSWPNSTQLRELYLQGNRIERLPDLSGMPQIVVVNLSRNAITSVGQNAFADLFELVALDLSHNRIAKLSDESFVGLKSLQILTLAHNRIQSVSGLLLSPLKTLHVLVLSQNVIENVDQHAFSEMSQLKSLSLTRNRIKSLHRDAFENCRSLRDLYLSANLFKHFPQAIKSVGATLQTLDLGENLLQHLHPTALSGLGQLYGLRLSGNKLRNLTENVFEGVENLRMLNLASNLLQSISKKAFSALKDLKALRLDDNQLDDINGLLMSQHYLQWLNVSHNQLQWFDYAFIPKSVLWLSLRSNLIEELANYYEMRSGFHLTYLDVGHNRLSRLDTHALQTSITEIHADHNLITEIGANSFLDLSNLTRINLSGNRLDKLPLNALALQLANGPADILLSGNPLVCDCDMEWLLRINKLYHTSPRQFPRISDWSDLTCSLKNRPDPSKNVENSALILPVDKVQPSEFICQYQTHCYALCMCCDFFACDCRMKCSDGCDCYHDTTWSANIIQCGKRDHTEIPKFIPMDATSIYLDGNNFGALTGDEFIGRKHLTSLFLNSSGIVGVSNKTLKGLTELISLHLDHNKIEQLNGREFEELTALKELHLNDNHLTWIADETFAQLTNLRILKLANNKLIKLPVWKMLRSLPNLNEVTLSGNPWSCQCDFVQKLQNVVSESKPDTVSDFAQLQCVAGSASSDIGRVNLTCADVLAVSFRSGDSMLSDLMPIVAVVAASIVIVVSLIILAVAVRKPLALWLRGRSGSGGLKSRSGSGYVYDCLIHVNPADEEFVRQTIVPRLDTAKRMPFRYQIVRQGVRADELASQLLRSHAVLVVASETYVQTSRKDNDLKDIVEGKQNKLVVVVATDAVTGKAVKKLVPKLIKANVFVWGTTDFWQNLSGKLPDPEPPQTTSFGDKVCVDKNLDDEMWTYLRGVKIESSLATGDGSPLVLSDTNKDHGFGPMQNSFSGPSGDSSLSTQSTDNSSGSLLNSKKRSATLSHNKNSPRLKADYEGSESGGAFLSSNTMFGRRPRDQRDSRRMNSRQPESVNSARLFENPFDKIGDTIDSNGHITSDSDYMSVNDTLLRRDPRPRHDPGMLGNNNEPIYHTLDDDYSTESKSKQVMMPLLGKDQTVYINADLEVVYPNLSNIPKRRDFTSDDDDDDCDAEFEHLLRGGHLLKGVRADSDCDDYENDKDILDNGYVPSPAPGSFPRPRLPVAHKPPPASQATPQKSFSPRTTSHQSRRPVVGSPAQHHHQQQQQQPLFHQRQRHGSSQQAQFDGYLI